MQQVANWDVPTYICLSEAIYPPHPLTHLLLSALIYMEKSQSDAKQIKNKASQGGGGKQGMGYVVHVCLSLEVRRASVGER